MDTLLVWTAVYFLLASQFYVLDKKGKFYLKELYLFFYNLGHRQEISRSDKGFVYNQSIATRLSAALLFDIVLSLVFWKFNLLETGMKIILIFIGTPVIFFGFWFGGFVMEVVARLFNKTVTTIDDIESGKLDPSQEIRESLNEVKENIEESFKESFAAADKTPRQQNDPDEERARREKEDEEALAALRAFQKGK